MQGIEVAIPGLGAMGLFIYLVFKQLRSDRSVWEALEEIRNQRDEYKRRTERAEELVARYRKRYGLLEDSPQGSTGG